MVGASDRRIEAAILHPCASGPLLRAQIITGWVVFTFTAGFRLWWLDGKTRQPCRLVFDRGSGVAAGVITGNSGERKDQSDKSKNGKKPVKAGERHEAALSGAGKSTQKL